MPLAPPEKPCVGVDESGRGTLFGPVVAAAVMLPTTVAPWMERLNDSKKLSAKKRTELAALIKAHAVAWAVGESTAAEIDNTNILRASINAMHRAISALPSDLTLEHIYVDGNYFIAMDGVPHTTIVGGDAKRMDIAAASIIAKVHRDQGIIDMCKTDTHLKTKYFMERHKGYGTKAHMEAITLHGPHAQHRMTFAPIAQRCTE